jgi:hypothetical protein
MKRFLQFFSLLAIFSLIAGVSLAQTNVTFTIDDQTQSYEKIMFKGTPTDWATIDMFDDGTNGDETAGDHIWTVIVAVDDGDHEWGAIEDDGSANGIWLIDGPNPAFNVTGGEVTGQTSYTIPIVEEVFISQAFMVDNQNAANVPFTLVQYKGTATNWANIDMYDDGTNGDETAGDHIWTVLVEDTVPVGDHEWGAVDQDDNWLISGPNVAFSVDASGNVTGQTTYVIEAWGTVPVTFTVDLNCQFNAEIMGLDSCLDVAMDGYPPVELEYIGEGDYQVTITRFNVGEELAYWYRIGCADDRPVEQQEYPGPDQNRTYTVIEGDNDIPEVWYQDDILEEPCEWSNITEFEADVEVSIYPNPVVEVLHIDILNHQAVDKVIVNNMLGQSVLVIDEVTESLEIPSFQYQDGIYFITIIDNNGATYTQKVIFN